MSANLQTYGAHFYPQKKHLYPLNVSSVSLFSQLRFPSAAAVICGSAEATLSTTLPSFTLPSSAETRSLLLLLLFPEQKHLLRLRCRLETCLCPAPCKTSQNTSSQAGGLRFHCGGLTAQTPSPTSGRAEPQHSADSHSAAVN